MAPSSEVSPFESETRTKSVLMEGLEQWVNVFVALLRSLKRYSTPVSL